jgi:hypothetical protein
VAIGYQQVDAKGSGLVQLVGQLQIDSTLAFPPQEARLKLDSKITGLDTLPLLKSVITVEALRNAFRGTGGLDSLEKAVLKVLADRFHNNDKYRVLAFHAFAQGSDDCKKLGITNVASLESYRQKLKYEKQSIRELGKTYGYPNGIGGYTYSDAAEHKSLHDASAKNFAEVQKIEAAFLNGENARAMQEANAIRKALEASAKCFDPITVKIQSLEAVAKDSKDKEYKFPIVTTPKK